MIFRLVPGPAGGKPVELLEFIGRLRYRERTVGMRRYWEAMQSNAKIERVIRCPRHEMAQDGRIVLLGDVQYQVRQVQRPEEHPKEMDLTLERVKSSYGLSTGNSPSPDGVERPGI